MQSAPSSLKSKGVRAGAGAGKTYNLTHTVMDFVRDFHGRHGRWPQVMVTTFTKKATQELSERLITLALEKNPELVDYMSSSAYLSVSTIHGILDQFLKKHGYLLGLNSDFTYLKNSEAAFHSKKLLKKMIESDEEFRGLLKSYPFSQLYQLLMESLKVNLQGYRVLTADDLHALLNDKLADLKGQAQHVLRALQGQDLDGNWKKLYEALQTMIPKLTSSQWETGRAEVLEARAAFTKRGMDAAKYESLHHLLPDVDRFVEQIKDLKETEYDSSTYEHVGEIQRVFARLRSAFVVGLFELKRDLNKIEISDLENWSASLIQQFPECAESFSKSKDFWLIDEFQDTSPLQVRILDALVGSRPCYVVGDPQQSIYLFRGARTEVFRDKLENIRRSGGEEQVLDTNYRSHPATLAFMNRLSEDLGDAFRSLKPDPRKEAEEVPYVGAANPVATLVKVSSEDPDLKTDDLEILRMAEQMLKLKSEGGRFEKMAVLMRTNDDLESVAAEFRKWDIPVLIHSSGFFWKRREVKDALCLLKFLINPRDELNLAALLRSPFIAMSEQVLADVAQHREDQNLWSVVEPLLREGALGHSGRQLLEIYKNREDTGLRLSFLQAMTNLGFMDLHLKYDPTGRAEGNLWKFVHLLRTFEMERGASFVQFINDAELAALNESSPDAPGGEEPNKVNLMTVHASKGLEFDHVFLPFIGKTPKFTSHLSFAADEDQKIWAIRSPTSEEEYKSEGHLFESHVVNQLKQKEMEQHWRLFYVAYTRAKKSLYLSWSGPENNSWASKITLDLTPGLHDAGAFTYMVEDVTELPSLKRLTAEASQKTSAREPFAIKRDAYYESGDEEVLSVTKSISGNWKTYQNSYVKKRQGVLFHRLLELMRYVDDKNFYHLIPKWFPEESEEVSKALKYVLDRHHPPYAEIIRKGEVEWPFVYEVNGKRTPGQIDLWGIVNDELWIVDYKSGKTVLQDKAFEQLAAYATALRAHLNWQKPIHLAVIYPFLEEEFIKIVV